MKRKMLSRLMAASLAAIMTVGMAGCGDNGSSDSSAPSGSGSSDASTPSESGSSDASVDASSEEGGEEGAATVRIDPKTGEPFDLGGMEIIIADWWSPETPDEPTTDFGEAQLEYQQWLQDTYNFKMVQKTYAGWGWGEGSIGEAFVQAATSGTDQNIIWVLTNSAATAADVNQGLMYDITKLDGDVIDLSASKWVDNGEMENWTVNGAVYGFVPGRSEPRGGLYFNKTVLKDAGIDPETIYDMQANGTWTWDAWVDIMKQVQRDTNNDGQIDVYGCVQNNGGMVQMCYRSNGGNLVSKDENGKYILTADSDAVKDGLHFAIDTVTNQYFLNYGNEDGSNWEEYKERFMNGEAAFMFDDAYCAYYPNGWLSIDERNVDFGYVMFPKGPNATDYVTNVSNNVYALPASYDDEKARKLMFALDVWTDDVPGYAGYYGLKDQLYQGMRDTRSVDETIEMMASRGVYDINSIIPNFDVNTNFLYSLGVGADVDAILEQNLAAWQTAVDEFNASLGL